jgi:hypothetical protein
MLNVPFIGQSKDSFQYYLPIYNYFFQLVSYIYIF